MRKMKTAARWFVGVIFIFYGVLKYFRWHWYYIDKGFSGEINAIPSDQLFWYCFGYSHFYVYLLGTAEIASGILLCHPRTYRIGALGCFFLGLNITILDFAYNVGPVRYWVLTLTLISAAIMASELASYRKAMGELMVKSN